MIAASGKFLSAGTRVRISAPTPVPSWSTWDNDGGRISTPVKKRLQQAFFEGDEKISAEVVFISNSDERQRMRNDGVVKVAIRDPAGCALTITAPADRLRKA